MSEIKPFLTTRQVARLLEVHEKVVYNLIAEKGLPATKVTGKWLFPYHLVTQWLENHTLNYPQSRDGLPCWPGLLIIGGSNDILLDRAIGLYNRLPEDQVACFANLGSLGGLRALRRNLCHLATSHLLEEGGGDYNFLFAEEELGELPAVVNFCRREQGLLLPKGNPRRIRSVADLAQPGLCIVNRPPGTGTRLLFDRELARCRLHGEQLEGYDRELEHHLDVGLEVLSARADAAPGIRAVAGLLDLDFLPLRWERFDLLIPRGRFFEPAIQSFLGLLHDSEFQATAQALAGYDLSLCGRMLFRASAKRSEDAGASRPEEAPP